MARKNAAAIAKKWVSGMQNATTAMQDGVKSVTDNPMEKAAAASDRYVAGVQKAANDGSYADGCRSVSLEAWRQAYLKKGVTRVSDGATQAQGTVEAFHAQHQPVADQSSAECAAAKADGSMDGKARMLHNYEKMKGFRFAKPRK